MNGSIQIMRHTLLAPALDTNLCGWDLPLPPPVLKEKFREARQTNFITDVRDLLLTSVVDNRIRTALQPKSTNMVLVETLHLDGVQVSYCRPVDCLMTETAGKEQQQS
jgi:hypothetical protein